MNSQFIFHKVTSKLPLHLHWTCSHDSCYNSLITFHSGVNHDVSSSSLPVTGHWTLDTGDSHCLPVYHSHHMALMSSSHTAILMTLMSSNVITLPSRGAQMPPSNVIALPFS